MGRNPLRTGATLILVLLAGLTTSGVRAARADAPSAPWWGDERFGVYLMGDPQQLVTLGTRWFIGNVAAGTPLPAGAIQSPEVGMAEAQAAPDALRQQVLAHPGAFWRMGNEPNVRKSSGEMTGEAYARALHDAVATMKATDPTAVIVGPNIINFDFTCILCPGYESGHQWMDEFISSYENDFGSLPPIDVWSIHTYPLDFAHFPQVNAHLMEDQLTEYRAYLDAIPGLQGAPIWDTEVGTHWGFDGLEWKDDGSGTVKAFPVGAYRADLLQGYMQELLGWLSANAEALNIQRWFFFATYVSNPEPWETTYGGVNLLDGPGPDAQLTPFGQLYRQLAGLTP